MWSDRPLRPESGSPGSPHSGAMRGNSTNSATITGAPHSTMVAAVRSDCASGGRPTGRCALTSAVSRPISATSTAAAVVSDCEKKKLLSTVKKPRKKITSASRRARASSVFSASSSTTSTTPASRPSSVRCVASVAATASTKSATTVQRPGSALPRQASTPRHSSNAATAALVHSGRCATCGATTQAITASRNSVSRASRGRADRRACSVMARVRRRFARPAGRPGRCALGSAGCWSGNGAGAGNGHPIFCY